ncbi:MAG: DUF1009 domain-containing protein [Alphaproteobacteria bacterium]|nr:MAG: DUF1009 domain-containing protein [Alphaproteobacteria bacterium]
MSIRKEDKIGKLGIIAGGGDLPLRLARACQSMQRPFLVLGIEGWAGPEIVDFDHVWITLGGLGRTFAALKNAGCQSVVIGGYVKRPDFNNLKMDMTAAKLLPKVLKAARKGDDALISVLVEAFEKQGFKVIGAEDVFEDLLADAGPIAMLGPNEEQRADIAKAQEVVRALGNFDIGQGAVVCRGLVLAIEAAEGTDEMLKRCANLPVEIRGSDADKSGVLVKIPKPGQERRVDLPTIGVRTIELANAAGLAGVAVAAGAALILDRDEVVETANRLGLFLFGIDGEARQE